MKRLVGFILAFQVYAVASSAFATDNYQDWWWNPALDGMGFNVGHQGETIAVAWYHYSASGEPTFLIFTGTLEAGTMTGSLIKSTGPLPGSAYNPAAVQLQTVGTATITFHSYNSATFEYSFEGLSGSIQLVRFGFTNIKDKLNKAFSGEIHGNHLMFGSDSTDFTFVLGESDFKLTRSSFFSGTCIFEGTYQHAAASINAEGTYECSDFSEGTFEATGLRLTPEGLYVGRIERRSNSGNEVLVETHAGM